MKQKLNLIKLTDAELKNVKGAEEPGCCYCEIEKICCPIIKDNGQCHGGCGAEA